MLPRINKMVKQELGDSPYNHNSSFLLTAEEKEPKKTFTDYPTLLAKRTSNHSSNFSPIVGKTLNRRMAEAAHSSTV